MALAMFDLDMTDPLEPTGSLVRLRLSGGEEVRARLVREGREVRMCALPHSIYDEDAILSFMQEACTRFGSNVVGVPASVLRGLRAGELVFKKQIDAHNAL